MKTADKRIVIFGATGTVGAYAALPEGNGI